LNIKEISDQIRVKKAELTSGDAPIQHHVSLMKLGSTVEENLEIHRMEQQEIQIQMLNEGIE